MAGFGDQLQRVRNIAKNNNNDNNKTKQNKNQKDSDHGLLRIYHISEMIFDLICSMQAKWKNAHDSSHNKILKSGEKSHFRSHHILKPY